MPSEPASYPLVGINIGGTTTSVVSGALDGTIGRRIAHATRTHDRDAYLAELLASVRALDPNPQRVGVAVGGPLDAKHGILIDPPHLPHLANFPLRERLEQDLGCPVTLHHDAAACALAEHRWGPDAGNPGLAYLTCGTGFGIGLVLDGIVRYGSDGHSLEIGHVRFALDGPPLFGKPGCYEGYASAKAIGLLYAYFGGDPIDSAAVVDRAAAGDERAQLALHWNVRAVASACALLADLLALDVVVLGSLALYLGENWIDAVREAVATEALPANARRLRLRAPMPGVQDRSGLAAALAGPGILST
ncbi:MAG: ROK family protein [Candidatus Velthaea sp.]|jgi:glucokinase